MCPEIQEEMNQDPNKPTFGSKKTQNIKSMYSMSYLDTHRLTDILRAVDEASFTVEIGMPDIQVHAPLYLSSLTVLYTNLYPLMTIKDSEQLHAIITNIRADIASRNYTNQLILDLKTLHLNLMQFRQMCGMGVEVKAQRTKHEKSNEIYGLTEG